MVWSPDEPETHIYGSRDIVVWMKTTVDIADGLLKDAKRAAEKDNTTVRALIEEGLRLVLKSRQSSKPFKLRDGSFKGKGKGLHPDIKEGDWETIRRLIYEGHGG